MESKVVLYKSADGKVQLDVFLEQDTTWLNLEQISVLFHRDKSVISRHIKNIFKEKELVPDSVVAKNATTASDGKIYQIDYFNLDVIISIGYRVKSKQGIQFRQWATNILQQHLILGYTINQKRLSDLNIEFEQALTLLSRTLVNQNLISDEGQVVVNIINEYARSWSLLQQYDESSLVPRTDQQNNMKSLGLENVYLALELLKNKLISKGLQ